MKFATVTKSAVMGLALLLASSAFAASKATMTLNHPTTVNGTQLKAGDYKLEWDGSGPDVQLSIVQGKNVIAKVPAKVVELNTKAANDAAVLKDNGNGTTSLTEARFAGKNFSLKIGQVDDGMQAGSSK
jgi:hypothetical protein